MSSTLERRYGPLLLAYPARYRRARGTEIIGTLMESSRPGQRWPSLADGVDLLAGGVRHRLGLSTIPALAAGLRLAGPIALVLAGGIGAYYLIVELAAIARPDMYPTYHGPGPLPTIGAFVYVLWIAAALARAVLPRLASRWIIGAAVVLTVLVVPLATVTTYTRPSLALLGSQLLLGLIALAGSQHHARPPERHGVWLGLVAVTGALVGLTYWYFGDVVYVDWVANFVPPSPLVGAWRAGSTLTIVGMVALIVLVGLSLVGAARPQTPSILWAAALLLVPGLPLVSLLAVGVGGFQSSMMMVMPAGLAAAVVVCVVAVRLARRDGTGVAGRSTEDMLRFAGVLALGTAVAMSWLAYLSDTGVLVELRYAWLAWPLAALSTLILPRWAARALIVLAVVLSAVNPGVDMGPFYGLPFGSTNAAMVVLGVIAWVGLPATKPPFWPHLGGLVGAAVLGSLIAGAPTVAHWSFGYLPGLPLAAIVPCVLGLVAGAKAVLGPFGRRWGRGAAVMLASCAWMGVYLPPFRGAWQIPIVLAGLLVALAGVAVWARRRTLTPAAG